jgi:hypothetical protein
MPIAAGVLGEDMMFTLLGNAGFVERAISCLLSAASCMAASMQGYAPP